MNTKDDSDISRAEIEQGLIIAAKLVANYGDAYWPIIDRLEMELGKRKMRRRKLKRLLDQEGFE